ncbi:MAG: tyrosine--tRNA ligase [Bacteroidetes bacterium]|nr:tyrosine--tRNA ligase [Bacteroidota bacterium]
MNFIEELKWRGMIHDVTPGTEDQLNKEMTAGYIGFDPTADSLHIGSLATLMLLKHFQMAGHKPVVLVGGATGMVGDPSGKSQERNLLDIESLNFNLEGQKKQLVKFLDFDCGENSAIVVNNYDWFKDYHFLNFIRDIGKHITINYMMAKDSVKKRLESGLSFTEFSYQLVQGYDFYWLHQNKNCKLQMGGSDQWGNITTGTELIRRKAGEEAFALTTPLVTKADGGKFGKTEQGNVWLDPEKTSPYTFYQFWMNISDENAARYIKIFSLFDETEIKEIIDRHNQAPHVRELQKALAKDITVRVHSEEDYNQAVEASQILFGKGTTDALRKLDERTLLNVFEGVPQTEVNRNVILKKCGIIDFLAEENNIFASKGEARRMLKDNGVSVNKEKVKDSYVVSESDLLNDKYILIQKGKKNYFLVKVI